METKDFKYRDYSDFYESAKHIIADIWEKATLEKIGFVQKPDDPEILGEHVRVGYIDEFVSDDLLEKAWKMPWGWGKKEDFKPILVIFGENLDILDGNSRIERDREAVEEILEFHKLSPLLTSDTEFHCWNLRNKTYCPKDWRDFK